MGKKRGFNINNVNEVKIICLNEGVFFLSSCYMELDGFGLYIVI